MDIKRVLIADDDAVTRHILRAALEEWNYEVVSCSNGTEALAVLLAPDAPQVAILDWIMPDVSGPEICARVRREGSVPYPIMLLLTIKEGTKNLVEGLAAGADDYLVKPIAPSELQARLQAAWRVVESHDELLSVQHKLESLAARDDLTNAWNRRAVLDILRGEISRAARGTPVAVAMVDVDHFKQVNDQYGHQVGDEVLIEFVRRVGHTIRDYDDLARYGGEEFLIVFPGCDVPCALGLCERVRRCVVETPFDTSAGPIMLSVSIGVAICGGASDSAGPPRDRRGMIQEIIAHADAALYAAKRGGRDRLMVYEDSKHA